MRKLWLLVYYLIGKNLPDSYLPVVGGISNKVRIFLVKRIFKKTGKINTIQKGVFFGDGSDIEIGDYSGIGKNAVIPGNIKIGRYVMIGPELYVAKNNHGYSRTDIPMMFQENTEAQPVEIGDDVWIGARVIITPGKRIGNGAVVAAGSCVTHDVSENSVWGGVPAKFIKSRS